MRRGLSIRVRGWRVFEKSVDSRRLLLRSLSRRSFVPIVGIVRNDKATASGRREGCLSYVDRRQNWHTRLVWSGSGVWGDDVLEGFEGARQINIWGICCRGWRRRGGLIACLVAPYKRSRAISLDLRTRNARTARKNIISVCFILHQNYDGYLILLFNGKGSSPPKLSRSVGNE